MKKGILTSLACLCTFFIVLTACNKENEVGTAETISDIKYESAQIMNVDLQNSPLLASVGTDGVITEYFSEQAILSWMVQEEGFTSADIASIEYGYNTETSSYEAYFTVIGMRNGIAEAYQAELVIDNNNFYLPGNSELMSKHTCAGSPCSSCDFERGGFLGMRIEGCVCNSQSNGVCNHTKSGGGGGSDFFLKLIDLFL